jgi:hypothetical protein
MIRKLTYSRHLLVVCVVSLMFICVSFLFPVNPVSDFEKYQTAALDFSRYIKGGALPFLYAPLLRAGLAPFLSALLLNLSAFFLIASVFPRTKPLHSFVLLFIGIAWTPWAPIINSDIPSVSLIIIGAYSLLKKRYNLGMVLFCMGLSMRLQTVAIAFLLLIGLLILNKRFRFPRILLGLFFIAIIGALAIDIGMKLQSSENIEILKSQRDPLYAGFLATQPGKSCGEITSASKQSMQLDQGESILSFIKIPDHVVHLILCKWSKMVFYGASGSVWLSYYKISTPYVVIFILETIAVYIMKLLCVWLFITRRIFTPVYISALTVFIGFFSLHTILEIQPRYMITPITISLFLLCQLKPHKNWEISIYDQAQTALTIT